MGSNKKLTKKDLNKVGFRSIMLNATFNYERMQATGFTYSMEPVIEKIYADDPEEKKERELNHLTFMNSHSYVITLIMGICAAMEEKREDKNLINSIKVALMGPLAGLGDSLVWFTAIPILAGIGISFAMNGNILGPIFFFIAFNLIGFAIRFGFLHACYKLGIGILDKIGEVGSKITRAAGILGMTVIGGLIASYVTLTTKLSITSGDATVNLQTDVFDSIMPNLLPLLYTVFIFYLIRAKKKSPTVLILITIAFCVIGSLLGIFQKGKSFMTGIIFTGHGTYGSGLLNAVSLLAGKTPFFISVDFSGENANFFKEELHNAVMELIKMECEQILILCDLLGGTPFNTAVTLYHDTDNVIIIYGTNVPFAVQLCLSVEDQHITRDDLIALINENLDSLGVFTNSNSYETESEDGL